MVHGESKNITYFLHFSPAPVKEGLVQDSHDSDSDGGASVLSAGLYIAGVMAIMVQGSI